MAKINVEVEAKEVKEVDEIKNFVKKLKPSEKLKLKGFLQGMKFMS